MRLFLGCPVPATPALDAVSDELRPFADSKVVASGSRHITLRFLGDVDDAQVVIDAMPKVLPPIGPCRLEGVGSFQNTKRALVAFAAVHCEGLDEVANAVAEATGHIGKPVPDRRFAAHVTLARFRNPTDISAWAKAYKKEGLGDVALPGLVLFESRLGELGPTYHELASWPLPAS